MSKYPEVDAAIVKRVREAGPVSMLWLFVGDLRTVAQRAEWAHGGEAYRIVDRRLQALKRAGVIKFQRGSGAGWVLA